MAEYMYNVEFQVQLVSFFTQNVHYDYSNHAQEEPAQESGLAHQQDETSANPQPSEEALVTEDKWVLNEPNKEMIRVHRKLRSQSYKPEKNNTPIPLEYLEDTRATKFEYEDGTSQQKVDNWRGKDAPKVVRQEKPWKGTTIFKVKPGGFERRTNVRVSISVGNRRGDVDEEIYVPDSVHEPSSSSRKPPSGGSSNDEVPGGKPLPGGSFNDEGPGPSQRREQKKREGTPVAKEDTSLEPRRVELPLPGQELSAASPSVQRMLKRLENEVELYKLHVKHYHTSPAQFRRRTSVLGLPKSVYEKYDKIVKGCKVCGTSVSSPPRARISGMRASEFGDVIFVDHQEIQFRTAKYVVLLVLDGATNLLWATAQKTLLPEETISVLRLWIEENNCVPKRVVGDTAFFTPDFEKFYKYHNIAQYPRAKDTLAKPSRNRPLFVCSKRRGCCLLSLLVKKVCLRR